MRIIPAKNGRSIVAILFLTVMLAGPIGAVGGVIISSFGTTFLNFIASAMLLA